MTTSSPAALSAESLFENRNVLRAFIECSDELQEHAKAMTRAMSDPELDGDEQYSAALTLFEILFPYCNESDNVYGLDLEHAERLLRDPAQPASGIVDEAAAAAALDELDREEADFAVKLQTLMTERGMTQTALAEKIGISQPAIAQMLKRNCRPQQRTIDRLAAAFDLPADELWPMRSL